MHYVKLEKGVIVEGPLPLSNRPTAIPNSKWPAEQLKLHGYVLVDLDYDRKTETLDLANPIISGDSVTYPRIRKSDSEKLNEAKAEKAKELKTAFTAEIFKEGDLLELVILALGVDAKGNGAAKKTKIGQILTKFVSYESQIQAAASEAALSAINFEW